MVLKSYEMPEAVMLLRDPLTPENGMLTSSGKLNRIALRRLAESGEEAPPPAPAEQQDHGPLQQQQRAAPPADPQASSQFSALLGQLVPGAVAGADSTELWAAGGDSLTAIKLTAWLNDRGVKARPAELMHASLGSLRALGSNLMQAAGSPSMALLPSHAVDWDAEEQLPLDLRAPRAGNALLLTGASGFLGACLLLRLLTADRASHTRIYCLVRAESEDHARQRLLAAARVHHGGGSDAAWAGVTARMHERVTVLVGDLARERLGLTDRVWLELLGNCATVLHCGAHVHTTLPYSALKARRKKGGKKRKENG